MILLNFEGPNNDMTPEMIKAISDVKDSREKEKRNVFPMNRRASNQHDAASIYAKAKKQLSSENMSQAHNLNSKLSYRDSN